MFFSASMASMHLIRHAWQHGGCALLRLRLCLNSAATTSARMASRFAKDKHLVSKTSTRRMHRLPMIFAFVRTRVARKRPPQSLWGGNVEGAIRRVGRSSMHQGCLNGQGLSLRVLSFSFHRSIPSISCNPCPPFTWAMMFCWAGRPQGRERTWVRETAGGRLPVRPADTVIEPVEYHRGPRGVLFLF